MADNVTSSLDPLRLPLEFALRPGAVGRIKGLHLTVEKAARRVQPSLPEHLRVILDSMVTSLADFDALDDPGRLKAVQQAHAKLQALSMQLNDGAPLPDEAPPPNPPDSLPRPRKVRRPDVALPAQAEPRDPLASPVTMLSGVGPKLAESLSERGISTLADLLRTTPRTYEDRTRIVPIASVEIGERVLVRGKVLIAAPGGWGQQRRYEVQISDGTGRLRLTWFRYNNQQMEKRFPLGAEVLAAGPVTRFGTQRQIVHPEVTAAGADTEPAGIVPIYPDLEGVPRQRLRKLIQQALVRVEGRIPELLPERVLSSVNLPTMHQSLQLIHAPPPDADIEKLQFRDTPAHKRLAFEEFFIMQVALGRRRMGQKRSSALPIGASVDPDGVIKDLFPFPPTGAQRRVVGEITGDLAKNEPMARLLQGDVGSGKTAVAAAAALIAVRAGGQAAVVAPTEILAEQHFRNLTRMLARLDVYTDLVTGKLTQKERTSALARLEQGITQVVVGTHALLQEGVRFRRLALACIDEQHRFGVEQRSVLRQKGPVVDGVEQVPHLLVMTATPIPRTLALTLYGDLEVSVIDEMPPGRTPIETRLVTSKNRTRSLQAIRRALGEGRQAYVVYPLVEESENSDLADATQGAELFRNLFPETNVELLHGRMSSADKDRAMTRFSRGEVGILVSTTVIEVGVDVPNATVMWIEHAERFGLSQLHQLRGRVGRGSAKSECYLVATGHAGEESWRRLQIMAETQDGFRIAEEDLAIRGPGDFFGTRQAGAPPFLYANLIRHGVMLEEARRQAQQLLARDPDLVEAEHQPLRHALEERYQQRIALAENG